MSYPKNVSFRGTSLADLRSFPTEARKECGFQIGQVQIGLDPDDWKIMTSIGQGVKEIRVRDDAGIFRVVYIAKFTEAVYVLHCFQKKTQQTAKSDIDLAKSRLKDLLKERSK
ncbi:type II toxin-antitoxin system RelE/ParE family toxin [Acidisoma silvae]|uniref:Type II toxin-antitoxin system RelE/ParE family toxin n=1 Tax=Acidisoma silvae TaxID=2802396 RepID=A0A963YWM1_9PROT|nr:type II toxin-antitoxin system RelE/ParE family toxin [Acidisoma silvae]MCB8878479.1 type II toxin-antitoxin system RelE/ParE family toxin [Acidisoma silvae]